MRKLAVILFSVITLAQLSHADINVTEGSGKTVKTTTSGGKEIQWIQIDASSNTVAASQSGGAYNVVSTNTVLGTGSNAIGSITNTGFNVNNSPAVFLATTSVSINGSSNTVILGAGTAEIGNVKNSGTFAVQAAQSGAFIVTQSTVGAIPLVGGAAVSASNPLPVQSTGTITVTGTVAATQSGAFIITGTTIGIVGVAAASTTASGNPIRNGVVVSTSITITPVGAGSIMDIASDPYGRLRITGDSVLFASSSGTAIVASTSAYQVIAAPGATKHLRIKYVQASNSGATTTLIAWREGVSGSARYETYLPQNGVFAHDLKPDSWDVASNTSLTMYSSAAGNVYYTIEYQVIQE